LCASIDRDFDKFELYVMRNILTVKAEDHPWIRLGHYQGLDFGAVAEGQGTADKPSLESVNGLRRRLLASQRLNGMLHAERTRNGALLAELKRITGRSATKRESDGLGDPTMEENTRTQEQTKDKSESTPLAFLRDTGNLTEGDAEKPLSTTTAFSLSQLQALRALSTSLRNIMPDLREDSNGNNTSQAEPEGAKSWRSERLEYVESATRRHLEHVRGLELGKNGEIVDGEWQGEGRHVGPEEVKSMENVAALFARPAGLRQGDSAMDEG
jgi:kinetochore protein Mis12/MTW1